MQVAAWNTDHASSNTSTCHLNDIIIRTRSTRLRIDLIRYTRLFSSGYQPVIDGLVDKPTNGDNRPTIEFYLSNRMFRGLWMIRCKCHVDGHSDQGINTKCTGSATPCPTSSFTP